MELLTVLLKCGIYLVVKVFQESEESVSTKVQVTCRKCKLTFTPSFSFDFYPDGEDPTVGQCENCLMKETFAGTSSKSGSSALPARYRDTICRVGKGAATCSFLLFGGNEFECAKGSTFEPPIRERLREGSMNARGDNCSGSPDFTPTTPAS